MTEASPNAPAAWRRQLSARLGNRCWVRGDRRVSIRSHLETATCSRSHRLFCCCANYPSTPFTPTSIPSSPISQRNGGEGRYPDRVMYRTAKPSI
ncbi:hypothetical protein CDAR_293911 [Caerostris darwini]|uniref:Uncharacterized protein n=1 Tax=Caerostris darwini TaxID=1538125 RepID=A0AAV4VF47_9ARAC|nr:hypothetical protein CDAR_293911 [Caerostris darwini]